MLFAAKARRLERSLGELDSVLVALSGGVDSAVLLGACARVRGLRVEAVTARSPAVPEEEIEAARDLAVLLGVPHHVAETAEMDDPNYRSNAGDRCYFCRQEMYGVFQSVAGLLGIEALADGAHAEDHGDDRPGLRAARERDIRHPLRDAHFSKADVRRLALAYGLPVHDKPAQPCLASRLPVGVEVTLDRLARVHRAEQALRALGFRVVRVRCEDLHGRIEIGVRELGRAQAREPALVAAVVGSGFESAALDARGYRTGGA